MTEERRSNGDTRRQTDGRRADDTPGPITRSDQLDARLANMDVPQALHDLQVSSRRSTTRDVVLALSIVLDVLLSLVVWRVAVDARDAANLARSAREQGVVLCRAGNESRADQVQLWQFVIQLSANNTTPQSTPAQKQEQAERLATFQQYLRTVFAPRDCSHVTVAQQTATTTTRPTTTTRGARP